MTETNKDNIRIHLPLSFVEKLLHEFNSLNGLKAFDSKSERVVASGKKSPKPMDKNGFDYSIIDKRYSVPFDEVINLDFVEIIGLLEEVTNGDVE